MLRTPFIYGGCDTIKTIFTTVTVTIVWHLIATLFWPQVFCHRMM